MPTKDELLAVAQAAGLDVDSTNTKAEIEAALDDAGIGSDARPASVGDYPERPYAEAISDDHRQNLVDAGVLADDGRVLIPQAVPGHPADEPL